VTTSKEQTSTSAGTNPAVTAWFSERLPQEWTSTPAVVTVDREEITVVLTVAAPEAAETPTAENQGTEETDDGVAAARAAAIAGRIARFREETRERRMAIAREAEHRFGRKVAWGVDCGETTVVFTSLAVPVMTRLRQSERLVLDTLVDAGVARSRAHALAWCVRLVGDNTATWLADLRAAMAEVEKVRDSGPANGVS
jgi:hypothetical protein